MYRLICRLLALLERPARPRREVIPFDPDNIQRSGQEIPQ